MSTRPVIGIITNLERDPNYLFPGYPRVTQNEDYARSVAAAGGIPVLLPPSDDLTLVEAQLRLLDGLVLAGGVDIDPALYGQEPHQLLGPTSATRDAYELAALRLARQWGLPTLGICRGLQVINVFAGGTLHQDLSLSGTAQKHVGHGAPEQPLHRVAIEEGSSLHRALGTTDLRVNSFHHQCIDRLGWQLRVAARAEDGTIEAIEWTGHDFPLVAVQWHPEMMSRTSTHAQALFAWFVRTATTRDAHESPRRGVAG